MSRDTVQVINQKDCVTVPKGSCFDLLVKMDGLLAAFAYEDSIKLDHYKYKHLSMDTWDADGKKALFIGIATTPADGYIWIANCKCIISAFVERKQWPQLLHDNKEWYHCKHDKCNSVSCDDCHEKSDECPFPHKTRVIYCEYNDEKKRNRLAKKIDKDDRSCSKCHTTLKKFNQENPYCKLMNWTPVPKTTNQL